MPSSTSVRLGDHFASFVDTQVAQGHYGSTRDVVHAGLQLLEAQHVQLEALRAALIEGENSGVSTVFDFEAFLAGRLAQRNAGA